MMPSPDDNAGVNASARSSASAEGKYTEEQLNGMTVSQIKNIASENGYSITKTIKADIIAEFLAQQGA